MIEERFIALATPRFIKALRPHLSIEKSKDLEYIKKSGKSFIGWHPTANVNRPLWEHFRENGLPSYFVERGALPNTVVIDPDGFLCDSSSYNMENWDHPLNEGKSRRIEGYIRELTANADSLEFQKSGRVTKDRFRYSLNIFGKEVIFVPLQLEGDTVIKRWSRWVSGVERLNRLIDDISMVFKDKVFLVKPHPLSKIEIRGNGNVFNVDQFHYKDCLENCDKVITINSGVGLQALAWGKPAIILGNACYRFEGLNYGADSATEVKDLIATDLNVDDERARRFLHFLKFQLYSDCIQTKRKASRFINRTDEVKYTKIRIFKKSEHSSLSQKQPADRP
jgi:hypothetical protein